MGTQAGKRRKRVKGRAAIEKKNIALRTLSIDYYPVESLQNNPYNPNRQSEHEFELLTKSMTEDGFTQPIVAVRITQDHLDEIERTNDEKFKAADYKLDDIVICDGEHRWRAAQHLQYAEVPLVLVPMTIAQMRIATLRHNRARGSEDIELSAEVLRDLQHLGALDWAKDSLMLDDAELNKLLDDIPAPEVLAADVFSTAWEPVKADSISVEQDMQTGKDRGVAASGDASARLREMEKKIAEAKDEQEKEQARKDANVYRLVLVFTGEQAEVVRKVLGDTPADNVLKLCSGRSPPYDQPLDRHHAPPKAGGGASKLDGGAGSRRRGGV